MRPASRARTTSEASFLPRTASTGGSPIPITSVQPTTMIRGSSTFRSDRNSLITAASPTRTISSSCPRVLREPIAPSRIASGALSPPITSRPIRMDHSPSAVLTWRPGRTYPQDGHAWCGRLAAPQLGQPTVCVARSAWCDRRLPLRLADVRRAGTAISGSLTTWKYAPLGARAPRRAADCKTPPVKCQAPPITPSAGHGRSAGRRLPGEAEPGHHHRAIGLPVGMLPVLIHRVEGSEVDAALAASDRKGVGD